MDESQKPTGQATDQPAPGPAPTPDPNPTPAAPAPGPAQDVAPVPPSADPAVPAPSFSAPVETTPQPAAQDETASRKRLSRVFFVLAAVFLIAAAGVAAWYFMQDKEADGSGAESSQSQTEQTPAAGEVETKAITFTSGLAGASTAELMYPAAWEVIETSEPYAEGLTMNGLTIASPSGHYLHIFDVDGIGGACDPDTKPYVLAKKLPTATEGVFFSEYQIEGQEQVLRLEDLTSEYVSDAHKQLKEGDEGVGVCENVTNYSSYGGVFVTISDSKDVTGLGSNLSFKDIEADSDFVRMLGTLKITDKTTEQ